MADTPKIRFKGFVDAWEQRKALELAEYSKGSGYSKGDLTEVGTPIILYGRLYTKYQFAIDEVDTFVIPQSGSVYSQGNEVIVPASGETAEDIARASAVEKSGILLGGDLNILRPFSFINPLFLALAISNGEPQKELAKKAQGKSVVHIHNSDIQEVTISYPLRAEQDHIVAVFRHLDHLITLHQHKCDETKELKRYMLQKMFPRNGKKNPEIRFAGFTDDWEQRKLGEVAKYRNGKAHENSISEDGKYIVVNSKFVSTNGEIRKFSDEQMEPLYVGEIAFVLSDVPNGRAIARTFLVDKSDIYTLNQRIAGITPNENTDSYFLYILMNRNKYFLKFDDGNKQTNLSVNDVLQFEEMYPDNEEQQKIGDYFKTLDTLITLHQRKCDEIKEVKKFMLQNMFPQKG